MEKHSCKLCFRSFANGRALGGHMRSHVAASTKAAAMLLKNSPPSPSPSFSSSSSRDDEDEEGSVAALAYGLRENPKKSFRLVDPEFSSTFAPAAGSYAVIQDRESESESSLAPAAFVTTHRRRSKRARRSLHDPHPEPEPVSSVSDASPDEDVAISLMMLSRDIWAPLANSNDENLDEDKNDEVEEEEDDEEEAQMRNSHRQQQQQQQQAVKGRSKYQCGTCKKVFRSYQALGGHRASHKKTNGCLAAAVAAAAAAAAARVQIHDAESPEINAEKLLHECPVCFRVFSSGQALGGHKRSHMASSASPAAAAMTATWNSTVAPTIDMSSVIRNCGKSLIDLNLPAPMEEGELSAVSDAEF